MSERLALGQYGEDLACGYLAKQGYKILERNFRTRLGEIDVVARDKATLCFVEVRARRGANFGEPYESVRGFKRKRLYNMARAYLYRKHLEDVSVRIDVVSIRFDANPPKIELFQNI